LIWIKLLRPGSDMADPKNCVACRAANRWVRERITARTDAAKKIYALLRELEEERGSTSVWRTRDLMAGIMAEDLKARWFEGEPSYTPWLDPLGSAVLLRALPTVSSDGRLSSMTLIAPIHNADKKLFNSADYRWPPL
jgi:hypothetical protein